MGKFEGLKRWSEQQSASRFMFSPVCVWSRASPEIDLSMHPKNGRSVLWITGIDSQLKNLIDESCDCENFYKDIINDVRSRIEGEELPQGHCIFGAPDNRTAITFSASYKPHDMLEDINVHNARRIIFLRPPHNTRQSSFVSTAQSLGLTFMSQQAPKIYPPMPQEAPLEGELMAFKLFSTKKWLSDEAKCLLKKAGEEAKQILHDVLVEILTNIITGKCSYLNH